MNDLRFALRQLLKSGGFSLIAIITLAIGIGLNTSMFSLMNLLVLKPIPYPDRDHLVKVYRTTPQDQSAGHNAADFIELKRATADFVKLAAYRQWGFTLTEPGRTPLSLAALRVSADFFPVLGLQPELGRLFTPDDDQPGNHVLILSHAAWQSQFGGDPSIINHTVSIDGEATTVVGVMPDKFSSLALWGPGDVFRPMALTDRERADHNDNSLQLLGRYEGATSLAQLNTRLATVARRLAETRAREQSEDGLRAVTLQSSTVAPQTGIITGMLLGLAGFVLLIVCGNLANLQLVRAAIRSREFAIRAALGATRRHLLRPLLTESILLALAGGVGGVLVTVWSNQWMIKRLTADLPYNLHLDLNIDWRVLTFALVASLLAGLVFGIVPALLASHVNVNEVLKGSARGSTGDRSQHRFRNALIVLQFAAALMLLSCTGFFIRGLRFMVNRDPGWTTAGITEGIINLPDARYPTPDSKYGFYTQLEENLHALPGVQDVGIGWTSPMFQFLATRSYAVEGREPPPPGHEPQAMVNGVTPTFLDTMKVKLMAGRPFSETDGLKSPRVVMINESMAKALFPGEHPTQQALGQRIGSTDPKNPDWAEIVGVFPDIGLAANPAPPKIPFQVFCPLAQETWGYVTVMVRSNRPVALTEPMRKVVGALDANVPVTMLNTAAEHVALGRRGMNLITTILASFSTLGLFLSALGLYGVIARLVVQRTPEIGIRLALGAGTRSVLWLMVGSGFRLTLIGTAIGFAGSLLIGMGLKATLAGGQGGVDYVTLPVATGLLIAVALLATYLPALRATRVNPLTALRAE